MKEVWIVFDKAGFVVGVLDSEEKAKKAISNTDDFYEKHNVK